jgi:methylmalonyl-CoA mutase
VSSNYWVNTFLSSKDQLVIPAEVRATEEEKQFKFILWRICIKQMQTSTKVRLLKIQDAAIKNENLFDHLMEATKVYFGQITAALFEVGGQYREICKQRTTFCGAKYVNLDFIGI